MIKSQDFNHPKFDNDTIAESLTDILSNNTLLSLATVKEVDGKSIPLNATCGFAFDEMGAIYILTPPDSEHGIAMHLNPRVALNVYDSHQDPQTKKQGLQIYGTCLPGHQADFQKGVKAYKERFDWMENFVRWHPEWRQDSVDSWIYKISPDEFKIFDEDRFGEEAFVRVTTPGPHRMI